MRRNLVFVKDETYNQNSTKMWKQFTVQGNTVYLDILPKILKLYNKGEDKTWTRGPWTPSLHRVHGPLSWTGSMDPLSWSMDSFFKIFIRFCTTSMDSQKQKYM